MKQDLTFFTPERMSEGWVEFTRYPCVSGYIDRWTGDCINNPNNDTKSQMQLNSFAEFYRCNDGKWYSRHDLKRNFFPNMLDERIYFTADEIFSENMVKWIDLNEFNYALTGSTEPLPKDDYKLK